MMARPRVRITADMLRQAKMLRGKDVGWTEIAKRLGLKNYESIRRQLDPLWAERRNAQIKAQDGRGRPHLPEEEFQSRSTQGADTRDLTAKLLGDPLPGRSALDRKKAKRRGLFA